MALEILCGEFERIYLGSAWWRIWGFSGRALRDSFKALGDLVSLRVVKSG